MQLKKLPTPGGGLDRDIYSLSFGIWHSAWMGWMSRTEGKDSDFPWTTSSQLPSTPDLINHLRAERKKVSFSPVHLFQITFREHYHLPPPLSSQLSQPPFWRRAGVCVNVAREHNNSLHFLSPTLAGYESSLPHSPPVMEERF